MSKAILSPLFPASQRDLSRLKQSATDAVNDFSSTATSHASEVGEQLRDLAHHVRKEGSTNFHRAKVKLVGLVNIARDFASERPLVCIGGALAVGFLIGLVRSRRSALEND